MKTDEKGCSTCPKGKEQWEEFKLRWGETRIQYDYRDMDGTLFSTVANSIEAAQERRNAWLAKRHAK